MALSPVVQARAQLLELVKRDYPELFRRALAEAENWRLDQAERQANPATISGLGDAAEPQTFWEKLSESLTSLGTAYLGYAGQKQVLDINLQRAQQGLPPIDPATGAPTIRIAGSLSPEIMARLSDTGSTLGTIALYGGLALGAIMLIKAVTGGKKRR